MPCHGMQSIIPSLISRRYLLNRVHREMTACVEDVDKITQEWEAVICASKEPAFPNPSGPSTHNEPAATLINLEPAPSQGRSSALGEKSLLEDDEDMVGLFSNSAVLAD